MQTPGLVIRKHASGGFDDAVCPRIDGCGLDFNGVRQCLAREGEQQSFQLQIRSNAEAFDFALCSIRCGAAQFISEER